MSDIKMLHLYSCELDAPTREVTLPAPLMHQDAYADVFRIHVTRGGLDLQLDGMTVRAWLYLAATGETMLLEGSADGSMVMVTLEPECYLFPGYATLAIQLQQGEDCRTLIKIDLAIKRTCTDTVIDPSNVLPTLPELLAQIAAMEQGTAAANAAAEAANTAAENAKEFIVTVNRPAYILDGDTSGITADKTYAEIQAAINAGKTPVVKLKTSGQAQTKILHLSMTAPVSIVFQEYTDAPNDYYVAGSAVCTFLSSGGITVSASSFRTVPDNGTEGQVLVKTGDSTYEWRDPSAIAGVAPAIIPTATGRIVTITDGAARPAVEVISHIAPVQAGSGDPSPDNVRPISGWNSVTAQRTGKNLLPVNSVDASQNQAGTVELKYLHAGQYVLSADITKYADDTATSTRVGCRVEYTDGTTDNFLSDMDTQNAERDGVTRKKQVPFNIREDKTINNIYIWLLDFSSVPGARNAKAENVQLEQGTVATPFVPYQGKNLSASLYETVYGGKYNLTKGLMTSEYGLYEFPDSDNSVYTVQDVPGRGTGKIITVWPDGIVNAGDNLLTGTFIAEAFVDSGITDLAYLNDSIKVWQAYHTSGAIGICVPADSTAESVRGILAGTKIAYKLATPYTKQLPAYQLSTLHGINNVWSDCGDTTISYVADTQRYIDNKLAAIAAATLNK